MKRFPIYILMLLLVACRGEKSSQPLPLASTTDATEEKLLEMPSSRSGVKEQIIRHSGYVTSYNEDLRIPNWVAYELTPDEARAHGKRDGEFQPDPAAKGATAQASDYYRSGYGRGHMAPAGDMKWSSRAMHESFYLSNVCPQRNSLNAGLWNDLEMGIRQMARRGFTLYIACGPIVGKSPCRIGKNRVAVPEKFYKVILRKNGTRYDAIGYIFPNDDCTGAVNDYACSVDRVESLTQTDFFPALPDDIENSIEAVTDPTSWKWQTKSATDHFTKRGSRKDRREQSRKSK